MKNRQKNKILSTKTQRQETKQVESSNLTDMIRKGGRRFLSILKQRCLRANNSWYRVLSIDKRRFIDAVIETVDKIQSELLLKILTEFSQILIQTIGGMRGLIGNLAYSMQTYGQPLAQRISMIAKGWGNKTASKWAYEEGFIRYLTVIDMNNLPIFRVGNKQ